MTKERTYKRTHPWLKFNFDPRSLAPSTWVKLGEIIAKIEELRNIPLKPVLASELSSLYLAKGVLATTAIEGNTMTEEEVRARIEKRSHLPPSREYQGQEIDNIVDACNALAHEGEWPDAAPSGGIWPSLFLLCNDLVLKSLDLEDGVRPGKIRSHEVTVGRYHGAPAEDCAHLVEALCSWLNSLTGRRNESPLAIAVIRAVLAHLYIALIHPFGDGNGRTARLIELHILLRSGVPMPACHLLSNHYNLTRARYSAELDQVSKSGGALDRFLDYSIEGLRDGLDEQLGLTRLQHLELAWADYVSEEFRGAESKSDRRKRDLAIALWSASAPVARGEIQRLSASLSAAYAKKTSKTVSRDLTALKERGLIREEDQGITVCREVLLAFMPPLQ